MSSINPFFDSFKQLFQTMLRAKGVTGGDSVNLVAKLPATLTDEQYAALAALVVTCAKEVVPDLIKLIVTLRPQVKETASE
jgi:hypothetical protein